MRKVIVAVCLAMLGAPIALPALAQIDSREGIALQNQILELRQELQNLQQLQSQAGGQPTMAPPPVQQDQGGQQAAPNDVVASLVVRVSALEEQMRSLQGRISEVANTEQHDHDDLAKQIGDLAFKLGQGAPPAGAPGGTPDQVAPATCARHGARHGFGLAPASRAAAIRAAGRGSDAPHGRTGAETRQRGAGPA